MAARQEKEYFAGRFVGHFASYFRLCQVAGWNGLEVPGMSFMIWTLVRLCGLRAQLLKY
jgi:hypothetical protein